MGTMVRKEISPFQICTFCMSRKKSLTRSLVESLRKVKRNSKREIFIFARAMLKVKCIRKSTEVSKLNFSSAKCFC